ncbi:MAG: zinc ribbon domain-containing protein [Eubacteriales bacterium]|nr:zinc ribbon domain-containing protein [Eubacteriales bacterium]
MGFLDKLTNTISSTGKGVEQKAKQVSGTVKLNSQIKELSESIQEYMRQVGELYYKKQEGVSDDPDIQELFEKIRNSEAEIAEAGKQIDTLKGICRCKNCGAEMRITDNFCMMCGTKREDDSQMLEQTTVDAEAVVTDLSEEEEAEEAAEEEQTAQEQTEEEKKEIQEQTVDAEGKENGEERQASEKEEEGIDPSEFEIG